MPPDKLNGGGSEVDGRDLEALLERLHDAAAFVDRAGEDPPRRIVRRSFLAVPPSVGVTELGETSRDLPS